MLCSDFSNFCLGYDIDLAPCVYELGNRLEVTIYETDNIRAIEMARADYDYPVILKIVNGPIWREAGDVVKVKVTRKNSSHSYNIKVL